MSWFPELLEAVDHMMERCKNLPRRRSAPAGKTFDPKPYWNHAFQASLEPEIHPNPATTATNLQAPDALNLPHPDVGSNRHGESFMFDRLHS
jgi:hypothetical protein